MESLNEQLGEVGAAWRVAYALNKPDELSKSERDIRRRLKLARSHAGDRDAELAALARIQRAQRIERRKRKGR